MQPFRTLGFEQLRLLAWIVTVGGLPGRVALRQADNFASAQVDGGENREGSLIFHYFML